MRRSHEEDEIHPDTAEIIQKARAAYTAFEVEAGFPDVQRDIGIDHVALMEQTGALPRPSSPNDKRLKYEIDWIEIQANHFLRLVRDTPTQKHFLNLLLGWASDAWENYIGDAFIHAYEDDPVVLKLNSIRSKWAISGWDKIAKKSSIPATVDDDAELIESVKAFAALQSVKEFLALSKISKQSYYTLLEGKAGPSVKAKARHGLKESKKV